MGVLISSFWGKYISNRCDSYVTKRVMKYNQIYFCRITENIRPIAAQALSKLNSFPIVIRVKWKVSVWYIKLSLRDLQCLSNSIIEAALSLSQASPALSCVCYAALWDYL